MFWIIDKAHKAFEKFVGGCTCICVTLDCENVISGGTDGEVRLWNIGKQTKTLQSAQKIHSDTVTAIKIIDTTNEAQIASCSLDGTIIIWKL